MGLYQNTGKPRFWIPITPFLRENNLLTMDYEISEPGILSGKDVSLIDLDPFNRVWLSESSSIEIKFQFNDTDWIDVGQKYFIGIIGHHFKAALPSSGFISLTGDGVDNSQFSSSDGFNQFNHTNSVDGIQPEYNGMTLREFYLPAVDTLGFSFALDYGMMLGSIVIGKVYDSSNFPNNADIGIEFTREYNYKKITTDRGIEHSNSHYMTNPLARFYHLYDEVDYAGSHYDHPTVSNINSTYHQGQTQGRSDLRSWDLTFSNVDEQKLFSKSDSIFPIASDGISTVDTYNFYKDNNTFDQLTHFTMGGSMPFIFQPDEDNFMPDQFAICRFAENSFNMQRDSFNTYRYSMGVREAF